MFCKMKIRRYFVTFINDYKRYMFCKMKMRRYFVTFINDSNITMIFNMGWILCTKSVVVYFATRFSWWCILLDYCVNRLLVELYYQICTFTTVFDRLGMNSTDISAISIAYLLYWPDVSFCFYINAIPTFKI